MRGVAEPRPPKALSELHRELVQFEPLREVQEIRDNAVSRRSIVLVEVLDYLQCLSPDRLLEKIMLTAFQENVECTPALFPQHVLAEFRFRSVDQKWTVFIDGPSDLDEFSTDFTGSVNFIVRQISPIRMRAPERIDEWPESRRRDSSMSSLLIIAINVSE
jgi:hypothetical protein